VAQVAGRAPASAWRLLGFEAPSTIGPIDAVQNLRRGHYELAVGELANRRLVVAFEELALAI
jgi:hypothetical protein